MYIINTFKWNIISHITKNVSLQNSGYFINVLSYY